MKNNQSNKQAKFTNSHHMSTDMFDLNHILQKHEEPLQNFETELKQNQN